MHITQDKKQQAYKEITTSLKPLAVFYTNKGLKLTRLDTTLFDRMLERSKESFMGIYTNTIKQRYFFDDVDFMSAEK